MNRYEKYGLSDQDLSLFRDYVDAYCSDDCQVLRLRIPVEDYLAKWETAKSKKLFNTNVKISFTKRVFALKLQSLSLKIKLMKSFLGTLRMMFSSRFVILSAWRF